MSIQHLLRQKTMKFWTLSSLQEYLECFPEEEQASAMHGAQDVVFLDASPAYLRTPAAAPHVQQAIPHAMFVIVLRVCTEWNYFWGACRVAYLQASLHESSTCTECPPHQHDATVALMVLGHHGDKHHMVNSNVCECVAGPSGALSVCILHDSRQ
jgi:hypothetical protein